MIYFVQIVLVTLLGTMSRSQSCYNTVSINEIEIRIQIQEKIIWLSYRVSGTWTQYICIRAFKFIFALINTHYTPNTHYLILIYFCWTHPPFFLSIKLKYHFVINSVHCLTLNYVPKVIHVQTKSLCINFNFLFV